MNSGDTVFLPVWQYMLTTSVATGITNSYVEIPKTKIYPNPTTGIFTITGENIQSIEVTNIIGQVISQLSIKNNQSLIVNLKEQPKGIYFVKIQIDSLIQIKNIILQ